ncbi:methyl farnesoate epoxidase-like [Amphibalanus amphitrite]|uniref:methyl farnesoate epoxidase-like n=1 Tax=Amphibalanus amphitrite TaxID=1232801 RepID=UPI001C929567|nr:methyl farnesoate epoxidase-like [Amphibalanus amphitrite]
MWLPLVALLFLLLLLLVWIRRPYRPDRFPPGPPTFLIFGNIEFINETRKGVFRPLIAKCRKEFGDIIGIIMPTGQRAVHLLDFDLIKEATAMPEFSGRPSLFTSLVRSFQQKLGIIFNEGPTWKEHRRFSLRHLRDLGFGKQSMEGVVLDEFESLAKEMEQNIDSPLTIHNDFFNITVLNVVWQMVASMRVDRNSPEAKQMLHSVSEFFRVVGPRSPMNITPWLRHFFPEWSGYAPLIRHRETTIGIFDKIIAEHRQTLDRSSPRDFIDQFLIEMESEDAEARQFTERNLVIVSMDFFVAGMETSATMLHWSVLLMVMYPDVQTRVQQELDAALGGRLPSYSDRPRLPYTEATLMEVSRRCTITPQGVPHSTTCDTTLAGYTIPKDTFVYMHLQEIHMDPEYWGDPEAFRPERFLTADGAVRHDERLIPFGVGKRFCLGETLARMETFILFAGLMQRFRFAAVPGQNLSLDTKFGVVQTPMKYSVTYSKRDGSQQTQ